MPPTSWSLPVPPYDIRERLFVFAGVVVRVAQFMHTRALKEARFLLRLARRCSILAADQDPVIDEPINWLAASQPSFAMKAGSAFAAIGKLGVGFTAQSVGS